jgi:peptidoglycan LD-endopeptidase LytH
MRWRGGHVLKVVAAAIMLALGLWLASVQQATVSERAPAAAPTPMPSSSLPTTPAAVPKTACDALRNMVIPVQGVRPEQISDTFSDARSEGRRHDASDIMAPLSTPVIAAAPGKVEKLFISDAGGNTVYVRSPDGHLIYYYAHLDNYAPGLTEGQSVAKGAPIGAVGSTGNANPAAPHLHFAIMTTAPEKKWWEEAVAVNPYPMLAGGRGEGLPLACR